MHPGGGSATFDEFAPETGTTFVTLEFTGDECVLDGLSLPLSGTVTGRIANTGVSLTDQSINFNKTEQNTGGGSLTAGGGVAYLTGAAHMILTGANADAKFKVE